MFCKQKLVSVPELDQVADKKLDEVVEPQTKIN